MPCTLIGHNPNPYGLGVPGYCMVINLRPEKHPLSKTRILLRSADPRVPRRQMGMLLQQGKGGKAVRRARRSAGLGVGTDPMDHRVRQGTTLPAGSGRGYGVLRERHSSLGRRSRVARDVAHRRNCNGLRDSCCAWTGPQALPCEVRGHLVLRQEQARDFSARSEHKHDR